MQSMQKNKKSQLCSLCLKKSKSMIFRHRNCTWNSLNPPFCCPGARESQRRRCPPNGRNSPRRKAFQKEEDLLRNMIRRPNSTLHVGDPNQRRMPSSLPSWKRRGLGRTLSRMQGTKRNWLSRTRNSEISKINNLNKDIPVNDKYYILAYLTISYVYERINL